MLILLAHERCSGKGNSHRLAQLGLGEACLHCYFKGPMTISTGTVRQPKGTARPQTSIITRNSEQGNYRPIPGDLRRLASPHEP